MARDSTGDFVALPRDADPYLLGEGGNCGFVRVLDGHVCEKCDRRHGEWHQYGCPNDHFPELPR